MSCVIQPPMATNARLSAIADVLSESLEGTPEESPEVPSGAKAALSFSVWCSA